MGAFAASVVLLLWLLMLRFVPAHPVEHPASSLPLVGALVCNTAALLLRRPVLRSTLIGIALVLTIAAFLSL